MFVGAGIFVTTVVAGSIAVVRPFKAMERPFLRDVIFYMFAVFFTFYVLYDKKITLGESLGNYTVSFLQYTLCNISTSKDPCCPRSRNRGLIRKASV